jgi:hypothetical protein
MVALDRERIIEALKMLDEELGAAGIRGEVLVVGGAAMALAYDARRSTADIDAIFAPSVGVRAAAARAAERLGFEPDWLNDAAKAFLLEELFPKRELRRERTEDREREGPGIEL